MEFIKNIDKTFKLSKDYNLFKGVDGLKNFDQGEVHVKVDDISMEGVYFNVTKFDGLEAAAETISEAMAVDLEKQIKKGKKILTKLIKGFEENPDDFKKRKKNSHNDDFCWLNKTVLSDKESMLWISVSYEKLHIHHPLHMGAGYGAFTYNDKEFYEKHLNGMDKWLEKELKKLRSEKVNTRIKNYINETGFDLTFKELDKYIELSGSETKKKKTKKPKFPIVFEGNDLNALLSEHDGGVIDKEFVEFFNEEQEKDFSALIDWEIEAETEGFHNHDGQVCDYVVEFMSPDGHTYHAENSHCLMTGWNFNGKIKFD